MELGTGVTKAFLAGAESTEVLDCSGDNVIIEVEVDTTGLGWVIVSNRRMLNQQ